VLEVYTFTAVLPKQETYGLSLQMRRAAVSIPANIAEGFRRRDKADKARFMYMAEGSVEECRYFLILAKDLGYGDTQTLAATLEESQPAPRSVHRRHSGFWLLTSSTPISRRDIKAKPWLVSSCRETVDNEAVMWRLAGTSSPQCVSSIAMKRMESLLRSFGASNLAMDYGAPERKAGADTLRPWIGQV
jgi:four helix bundle protein